MVQQTLFILMRNRNAKILKVYSARITTSKQLFFANLLRISITDNKRLFVVYKQVNMGLWLVSKGLLDF